MEVDKKDFINKWNEALEFIGFDIVEALQDKLTKEHGKDTGFLQSKIKYEVDGDTIIITMPEYGKYVDRGTPPGHMPPVEALEGWCERKLGDKNLAWAVAKHIEKHGTRPYPFIRNTLKLEVPEIIMGAFRESFK